MAKANKKSAKGASVSNNSKKTNQADIKNQIVEVIKTNHAGQIEKGEPVINSYAGLHKLLSHLKPDEINAALAQMNSVRIIDGMAGSLEFFPTLF
jgi:hypothetical protein